MDDNPITIDNSLYSDNDKIETEEIIEESKSIVDDIDYQFVDKVVRIILKGQIDGS